MPFSPPVVDARSPAQHRADWDNPLYAGTTCKARRSVDAVVISIGSNSFRVEPEAARKLAEQILAVL